LIMWHKLPNIVCDVDLPPEINPDDPPGNVVPRVGKKYLVIRRQVSAIGTLILAAAVIRENLRTFVNLCHYDFFEPVALALFVFSHGWVAAEKVFSDERRLLSIENELAIAVRSRPRFSLAAFPSSTVCASVQLTRR
jgi:hypothetical protein